jgi:hypothetical protein
VRSATSPVPTITPGEAAVLVELLRTCSAEPEDRETRQPAHRRFFASENLGKVTPIDRDGWRGSPETAALDGLLFGAASLRVRHVTRHVDDVVS